jgi:NAD(P)-dependent dehydrogenase (short-subunit alcohol dehydrogenase family)
MSIKKKATSVGSGIGFAIADSFAAIEATVVGPGRDAEKLESNYPAAGCLHQKGPEDPMKTLYRKCSLS